MTTVTSMKTPMKALSSLGQALTIVLATVSIANASPLALQPSQPLAEFASAKQNSRPQADTDSDIVVRAMYKLLTDDSYALSTGLLVNVSGPGLTFSMNVQTQTMAEQPNRFQTSIQFPDAEGNLDRQYTVTSDGQQVWIFDADQNTYSVMSYRAFRDDYKDSFLIGFLTDFRLDFVEEVNPELFETVSEADLFQNEALLNAIENYWDFSSSTMTREVINGTSYIMLTYANPKEGTVVTIGINLETSLVETMRLTTPSDGLEIDMQETITHQTPPAVIPQNTFTFVPPRDAQLSDTPVSIGDF